MYKKSAQGWLKHWDFILLDIICLQLSFVVAYYLWQGMATSIAIICTAAWQSVLFYARLR